MQDPDPEGVGAVVLLGGESALYPAGALCPDRLFRGHWAPPAGAIEPGETQADAVMRETWEEAGVKVRPRRKVWECFSPNGRWLLHWWLADYVSGEPLPDPAEATDAAWLTVEEFVALNKVFDSNLEFFCEVFPHL